MLEKIKDDILSDPKKRSIIIGILIFVLIAIVVSSFIKPSTAQTKSEDVGEVNRYEGEMEKKIHSIITSISGVGECKVMVTVDNVVAYEYVKESKEVSDTVVSGEDTTTKKSNYEEKYIFIEDSNGKRQALVKQKLSPRIRGVVIVCDGGDNPVVVASLVDTVTTIFGIKSTQIAVSKLSS